MTKNSNFAIFNLEKKEEEELTDFDPDTLRGGRVQVGFQSQEPKLTNRNSTLLVWSKPSTLFDLRLGVFFFFMLRLLLVAQRQQTHLDTPSKPRFGSVCPTFANSECSEKCRALQLAGVCKLLGSFSTSRGQPCSGLSPKEQSPHTTTTTTYL